VEEEDCACEAAWEDCAGADAWEDALAAEEDAAGALLELPHPATTVVASKTKVNKSEMDLRFIAVPLSFSILGYIP